MEFSTQRVDFETVDRIKDINRHLNKRGIRLRQSDIIRESVLFVIKNEANFLDYVENKYSGANASVSNIVSQAISKPWFPY
ncbi:MAG: hypothetical protein ABH950_07245 [Candidatus Altiarchaeota archaeon]